jgi:ABC-2 type transport system ATP-binding protein
MISINKLDFCYPGSDKLILRSIDLTIKKGSLFGLLGPNGAGKTTLISLLTGLYPVTKGSVVIDQQCLQSNQRQIKKKSGYVPQDYAFYPNLTAYENLDFFAGVQGLSGRKKQQRIEYCLEFCQLQGFASQAASTFSGGLKRRLNLSIGLLTDPDIIYFDEPTVGIDPQSREFILEKIKSLQQQGKTIIYTSHYMEEVEKLCDYVAIIDHGQICVQGALSEIQQDTASRLVIFLKCPLSDAQQQQLSGSFIISEKDKVLTFEGVESLAKTNTILSMLASLGLEVNQVHYGKSNLEELFMKITKRELRD